MLEINPYISEIIEKVPSTPITRVKIPLEAIKAWLKLPSLELLREVNTVPGKEFALDENGLIIKYDKYNNKKSGWGWTVSNMHVCNIHTLTAESSNDEESIQRVISIQQQLEATFIQTNKYRNMCNIILNSY